MQPGVIHVRDVQVEYGHVWKIQPEDFLTLPSNIKTTIGRTGTMSISFRMNYLHNILRGESLRYFDEL